jgi:hypothetical protein
MNTSQIWHDSQLALQKFLDVLFPVRCAGCQRSGHVLCPDCIAKIQLLPTPFCQLCGTPLSPEGICKNCQYRFLKLHGQRAVSLYQEPMRGCIHALKYDGNTRLAQPLGQLLAQAYRRCFYNRRYIGGMRSAPVCGWGKGGLGTGASPTYGMRESEEKCYLQGSWMSVL